MCYYFCNMFQAPSALLLVSALIPCGRTLSTESRRFFLVHMAVRPRQNGSRGHPHVVVFRDSVVHVGLGAVSERRGAFCPTLAGDHAGYW